MFMLFKPKIILFFLVSCQVFADLDINDIYIQGDSTLMGMRIESSYFTDGAFLIETTGARFEYVKGELKIYQGLDKTNRRLLSTVTFDNEPNFIKVKASDDHILLWSKDLNLGIYGDSTLIVSPKVKQTLKCRGNFKPDYEGRYKGELLLINDGGGIEIYPQRYEAGYEVKRIELGKKDWAAEYQLNVNERVMIAAFPGKPFDWEKSFNSHIVITTGGFGDKHPYAFGVMPSDDTIRRWAKFNNIIVVHHNGLWRKNWGPYIVVNQPEFQRLIATAHKYKMKVAVHASMYYFFWKNNDPESFYQQVKAVYDKYGTDGVYIDGLCFDGEGHKIDDKMLNWEMIRRFRQLFGKDGIIVIHDTSLGSPVGTVPNIDSYCDVTLNGEGIPFKSVNDTYIKYQVRKYGISNTIALWDRWRAQPDYITDKQVTDALLAMNGRQLWGAHAFWRRANPDANYRYYMERLAALQRAYYQAQKSKD